MDKMMKDKKPKMNGAMPNCVKMMKEMDKGMKGEMGAKKNGMMGDTNKK